jgi:hypothetical protein
MPGRGSRRWRAPAGHAAENTLQRSPATECSQTMRGAPIPPSTNRDRRRADEIEYTEQVGSQGRDEPRAHHGPPEISGQRRSPGCLHHRGNCQCRAMVPVESAGAVMMLMHCAIREAMPGHAPVRTHALRPHHGHMAPEIDGWASAMLLVAHHAVRTRHGVTGRARRAAIVCQRDPIHGLSRGASCGVVGVSSRQSQPSDIPGRIIAGGHRASQL